MFLPKNYWYKCLAVAILAGVLSGAAPAGTTSAVTRPARTTPAAGTPEASDQGLTPILSYISSAWDTLTRSMTRCNSVVDPKLAGQSVLYLPADFAVPPAVRKLQQDCKID